jgi:hypothetical protein
MEQSTAYNLIQQKSNDFAYRLTYQTEKSTYKNPQLIEMVDVESDGVMSSFSDAELNTLGQIPYMRCPSRRTGNVMVKERGSATGLELFPGGWLGDNTAMLIFPNTGFLWQEANHGPWVGAESEAGKIVDYRRAAYSVRESRSAE